MSTENIMENDDILNVSSRPIAQIGRFRNFRYSLPYEMFISRRENTIKFAGEKCRFYYAQAQEERSDNGFHHFEVFLNTKNSMSIKSLNKILEINHSWGVKCEDLEREVDYVRKVDTRVEGGEIISIGTPPSKIPFFKDIYKQLLNFETFDDAMTYLRERDPQTYVLKRPAIEACLTREHRKKVKSDYTEFNIPFLDVSDGKCHIFVGDTGIGKTNFALAHFENPVMISERQDFANISVSTDGIVIDDCTFKSWLSTNLLHIVDVAMDRSINIKYGTAIIPAHLPRIITLNDINLFWPTDLLPKTRAAISRRIVIHDFDNVPLYMVSPNEDHEVSVLPVPDVVTPSILDIPYLLNETMMKIPNFYLDSTCDLDASQSFCSNDPPPQLVKYCDESIQIYDSINEMPVLDSVPTLVRDFNSVISTSSTPKMMTIGKLVDYSNTSSHFSLPADFFIDLDILC